MGAACSFFAGAIIFALAVLVATDNWIEPTPRLVAGVIGVIIGGGSMLHVLGVW